jgi:hypothetical protein
VVRWSLGRLWLKGREVTKHMFTGVDAIDDLGILPIA